MFFYFASPGEQSKYRRGWVVFSTLCNAGHLLYCCGAVVFWPLASGPHIGDSNPLLGQFYFLNQKCFPNFCYRLLSAISCSNRVFKYYPDFCNRLLLSDCRLLLCVHRVFAVECGPFFNASGFGTRSVFLCMYRMHDAYSNNRVSSRDFLPSVMTSSEQQFIPCTYMLSCVHFPFMCDLRYVSFEKQQLGRL